MDQVNPCQVAMKGRYLYRDCGVWRHLQDREHHSPAAFWRREELFHYFYSTLSPGKSKCCHCGGHLNGGADAVFNVKFNQEGILVAVLASGGILLLDPRTGGQVARQASAHEDCVNVVCFMDNVRFFTGSDDHTIRLWDSRNMSTCVECLVGHQSWVKNLEYDARLNFLYSSGFDDTVRVWDVGSPGRQSSVLIHHALLFRMCVSPECDALVYTTRCNLLYSLQGGSRHREEDAECISPSTPSSSPSSSGGQVRPLPLGSLFPSQSRIDDSESILWEPASVFPGLVKHVDFERDRRPRFLPPEHPSGLAHQLSSVRLRPSGTEVTVNNMYSVCFNRTGRHLAMRGTASTGESMQDLLLTCQFPAGGGGGASGQEGSGGTAKPRIVAEFLVPRQEPGIIKEIAFDPSGRLIATPCGSEVVIFDSFTGANRILGRCGGCDQGGDAGNVLSCQFSPTEPLVASGNMSGCVDFHYPKL